jgi:hypothetical protein
MFRFAKAVLARAWGGLACCIATGLVITAGWSGSTGSVQASDLTLRPVAGASCQDFVLSCDNGRDYAFCPRAVSAIGDVVTGTLLTGPHTRVDMRLIPMGVGYRYAGKGIWFDGYRSAAALNFGKYRAVACTIRVPQTAGHLAFSRAG